MTIALFIVSAIALVLFGIALFLGKEMFKKFRFMQGFILNSNSLMEFNYKGAKQHGWDRGMRNIIIRWNQPFSALVGFKLTAPVFGTGFDYYGYAESREIGGEHLMVMSTYFGNGPCLFQFFLNRPVRGMLPGMMSAPTISSDDQLDQAYIPSAVYPPHFYQRLGFYA